MGWIVVALVVVGALGAIFGGDDDEATTAEPSSATTSASTPTPSSSSPPPAPRPPAQRLRLAILDEIGEGNRDGAKRLKVNAVGETRTPIVITWASSENLTEGLTKDSLRLEATDILKIVQKEADWRYNQVILVGTYPLVDQLGNTKEQQVVRANYSRGLVDQINFEGFSFKNVFEVADAAIVHPAFQN